MGSFKGLKQVRRIVEDCIQNVQHPIYHIKVNEPRFLFPGEVSRDFICMQFWLYRSRLAYARFVACWQTLLMKRELAKNPALANENWERFLPKFKKYILPNVHNFCCSMSWMESWISYPQPLWKRLFFTVSVLAAFAGKMFNRRKQRQKRRSRIHLSHLLNSLVR